MGRMFINELILGALLYNTQEALITLQFAKPTEWVMVWFSLGQVNCIADSFSVDDRAGNAVANRPKSF